MWPTRGACQAVMAFAGDSVCWAEASTEAARMPASTFAWKMSAQSCSANLIVAE